MSDHIEPSRTISGDGDSRRGQSLVEFALVLPLLIVLLLGIADFGRVFQAGIVTESAARAAAEVAALEYLRNPPSAVPAADAYYERLHRIAAETVCEELRMLPNTTYAEVGGETQCMSWPAVAVCVHDDVGSGGDTRCTGSAPSGYTSGPSECTAMSETWNATADEQNWAYVEVRVCYHFTTLVNLDFALPMNTGLSLGDVYLQKEANFTVADY
jgi:hypothetical protein